MKNEKNVPRIEVFGRVAENILVFCLTLCKFCGEHLQQTVVDSRHVLLARKVFIHMQGHALLVILC